jgi:hypothetical protein
MEGLVAQANIKFSACANESLRCRGAHFLAVPNRTICVVARLAPCDSFGSATELIT